MVKKKNPTKRQRAFGKAGKKAAKEGLKPGTKEFGARVKALLNKMQFEMGLSSCLGYAAWKAHVVSH